LIRHREARLPGGVQIKGNSASCQGNGYSDRWFPIAHQLLLRAQGVLQAALQTVIRWDRRSGADRQRSSGRASSLRLQFAGNPAIGSWATAFMKP
jgi:hypothetical protein